jgi:ribose transport system substrate-binding protein
MDQAKMSGGGISRRRLLTRGGAFALAVPFGSAALAGCGSSDDSSGGGGGGGGKLKAMQNYDETGNEFWTSWVSGGKDAAAALGIAYGESVSDYDVDKQRSLFENAKTQGFNGVTMKAVDEGASANLIKLLTSGGIKVVDAWTNAPWSTPSDVSDDYVAYVSANDYLGSVGIAEVLAKKMGGKGNLVHLEGVKGQSSDTERTFGLDAVLKANPGIKLIARQPADYVRTKGQSVMENILNAGKSVDGVFCQNDDMAIGALKALSAKGGKLPPVVGMDGTAEMLDAIVAGRALGTWSTLPRYGAGLAMVRVFDALHGVKSSLPERMMGWGTLVIDTPESAAAYKTIAFAKVSPWDWKKVSRHLNPDSWDPQSAVVPMHPDKYWERRVQDKPSGYELPKEYTTDAAQFATVRQDWLSHYKNDPLKPVLDLTSSKKPILAE